MVKFFLLLSLFFIFSCAMRGPFVGETAAPLKMGPDCIKWVVGNNIESIAAHSDYCKNYQNEDGVSALMMSVYKDRYVIFEALLDAGSDVQLRDKSGTDVLFYAVNFNRLEMIKRLRASGSKILMNEMNVNALWVALQKSNSDVILALNPTADEVNLMGDDGWTAIYFAIRRQEEKVFDLILKAGALTEIKDSEGVSPLEFALNEVKWDYAVKSLSNKHKKRAK